ncbi:MAG: heme-binding Shp domain-containing protein [bacterium]|nr:heme-binding Shp domain-containing protein [bacterium]
MKHYTKYIISLCLAAIMFLSTGNTRVMAMSDGAYTVSVSYSYKNPETNQTADGGSNIALGESMIESMLEKKALVEQVNGKTYVTVGIGLMSNISSVNIQTQSSKGGSYKTVSTTKTGSSTNNGDTVNHYRFQMSNTNCYISPKVFVDPMGREVQFFIKLNMGTAKSGTGIYKSEMVAVAKPTATAAPKKTAAPVKTTAPKETESAKKTAAPVKTETAATTKPTQQVTQTTVPTEEAKATEQPEESSTPEAIEEVAETATPQPESTEEAEATTGSTEAAETAAPTETPVVVEASVDGSSSPGTIIAIAVIAISLIGSATLLVLNKKGRKND